MAKPTKDETITLKVISHLDITNQQLHLNRKIAINGRSRTVVRWATIWMMKKMEEIKRPIMIRKSYWT